MTQTFAMKRSSIYETQFVEENIYTGISPPSKVDLDVIEKSINHLGPYVINFSSLTIGQKVGQGGFGIVYRGMYNQTPVAIKQIKLEGLIQVNIEDFVAEASTMSKLSPHPNVVLFRGVTLPPDPFSIVVDFCEGGSLIDLLYSDKVISNVEKLSFIRDIAQGMCHLHKGVNGIAVIHRDLAVRNILLSRGNKAMVSDFGMARIMNQTENSRITKQEIGPIKWMAPESIEKRIYSVKSDVFSFGVVIWEIITRKQPWETLTGGQVSHKVIIGERMEIPSNCSKDLHEIIESCWKQNPEERPNFSTICDKLHSIV